MARKKQVKTKRPVALKAVVALCLSCVLVASVGFGVASANGNSSLPVDSFGVVSQDEASVNETSFQNACSEGLYQSGALFSPQTRNISAGIEGIEEEEAEAARKAEEERLAAERAKIEVAEQAQQQQVLRGEQEAIDVLPAVDWEVGEEAFVSEWASRIDAYLAGSPLAGMGSVFAQAAWDNGVDPRWSPAISNTESSKGAVCFKPYNAWGWGSSGWSSWEEAIRAHVAGLAAGYGYTLSTSAASKYCPPTAADWYQKTLSQMMCM